MCAAALLSPETAKAGGTISDGAFVPFILTADRLDWVRCLFPYHQHCLFPLPDLRPKRSEGRDGIDMDEFVHLPHRCFGGVIRPPSHVRLEQLLLAHGIDHGLDRGDIFI